MKIVRDYQFVADANKGATVAIGNFDGVHYGHQAVIKLAREAVPDAPLGVLTFEPHPREYFAPDAPAFRLMNAEARATRLRKLGVDVLYELQFNTQLAELTPEAFAANVISQGLGLCHVVVGEDFCFGKNRAGDVNDLKRFGSQMGFGVTVAELITSPSGAVSSTAIRTALNEGDPRRAAEMLGHWHRIEGEVISGEQRGRVLGYPTANMSIDGLHPPKYGVYAVLVDVLDGPHAGSYHGASSIGVRPMFGENRANLETFLFDFKGDLYGSTVSIALVDYLRPEEKFDSLEALITQMDADCARARAILSAL
ncbi:bifunctional riboflavin kinase/FAD synthetase [Marivita geojedonensis]|uniref:Riboflavin biosynthesis protein n=1 Tax=Marivita geojedonensis TaxID=1123756 RepID=A0A1X4NPD4_9RHOB|nr:bifunctional riboflavin kinase/FAD synthetase [Marivita geojedonensis]OSQ52571.1 riboflavin biosynthesis protein RibF [Marivita geojedonensis]PRY80764.1 FMN adenylyltransferase /riboflavin kinase [Marivita geojedonensis]